MFDALAHYRMGLPALRWPLWWYEVFILIHPRKLASDENQTSLTDTVGRKAFRLSPNGYQLPKGWTSAIGLGGDIIFAVLHRTICC